ncbi:MAG: response regulator [Chloroflexota bacterium]
MIDALIVENEPELAALFTRALESAGFKTKIIRDGQRAIDHLSQHSPKLVLLDLMLPGVGGPEILRYIRQTKHGTQTKVIVASANALLAEPLRGEADLVLNKPVSYGQLRDLAGRLYMALG